MVRGEPSEIGEIVAKRRKDFTEEFFKHVYTVAASYHDKHEEQDGERIITILELLLCCSLSLSLRVV